MHLRFRAVIKCWSAYEAELPVEGVGSGHRAITDAPSSLLYWELVAHRAHGSAYFVVARRG